MKTTVATRTIVVTTPKIPIAIRTTAAAMVADAAGVAAAAAV